MFYMNITNPKNKDYPTRFSYINSKEGQQFAVNPNSTLKFQARYDQMVLGEYGSFLVRLASSFTFSARTLAVRSISYGHTN